MSHKSRKRIVWLYEKNHLKQPFIKIALDSLVRAGHKITIIDTSDKLASKKPYKHVALVRFYSFYVKLFLKKYNLEKVGWILPFMFLHTILRLPSVIIGTMPAGITTGWLAAKLLRARLVYYPMELYGEQHGQFSPFWLRMEELVLRRGIQALIVQNERRARIYIEERNARVNPSIVHNYKPESNIIIKDNRLRNVLNLLNETKIVLYEGTLMQGRWLDKLIEATIYLAKDTKMVFMGKPSEYWQEHIAPMLKRPDIGQKVVMGPWIKLEKYWKLLSHVVDADVGIIIYDDTCRNNYFCEPGKLSDYVQAGVPVVAPNFPTIGPIIERYDNRKRQL
jgi:hypothetical protein